MELDGLIQVRRDAPLLESEVKTDSKVIEKRGSTRTARGKER